MRAAEVSGALALTHTDDHSLCLGTRSFPSYPVPVRSSSPPVGNRAGVKSPCAPLRWCLNLGICSTYVSEGNRANEGPVYATFDPLLEASKHNNHDYAQSLEAFASPLWGQIFVSICDRIALPPRCRIRVSRLGNAGMFLPLYCSRGQYVRFPYSVLCPRVLRIDWSGVALYKHFASCSDTDTLPFLSNIQINLWAAHVASSPCK